MISKSNHFEDVKIKSLLQINPRLKSWQKAWIGRVNQSVQDFIKVGQDKRAQLLQEKLIEKLNFWTTNDKIEKDHFSPTENATNEIVNQKGSEDQSYTPFLLQILKMRVSSGEFFRWKQQLESDEYSASKKYKLFIRKELLKRNIQVLRSQEKPQAMSKNFELTGPYHSISVISDVLMLIQSTDPLWLADYQEYLLEMSQFVTILNSDAKNKLHAQRNA